MLIDRGRLLEDQTITGAAWCRSYSAQVDAWLTNLFEKATASSPEGLALIAVGGYGRSELCPASDIDVMLLHGGREVRGVADQVWYPLWDAGFHVGHSVSTLREALRLAAEDLDTATALLSARLVAGDTTLARQLAASAGDQWRKKAKRWLPELAIRVEDRHTDQGEVAFLLEPDLKEGRGGLRDVHALGWAEHAHPFLLDGDRQSLVAAYGTLLDARVELHRSTGRATNVLPLQEQATVAAALGDPGPDQLMARIAEAARTIAWTSDDTWHRIRSRQRNPLGRISARKREVAGGIEVYDGEVSLQHPRPATTSAVLALRVAAAAARHEAVIERHTLEVLAEISTPLPDPWPADARDLFVELLLSGPPAVKVIEALDQRGIWVRILPEWSAVRARPQHNSYHRYTVDRHLLETVAHVAGLTDAVSRPDLLAVAALLHDLGKGYPGDHTEAGTALARTIASRMGYGASDAARITSLVELHLLLPDVATRRDLDDPSTIERVAAAVGSVDQLLMLAALTEADSRATGPVAWGPWKAELVTQLTQRVTDALEGGTEHRTVIRTFPTAEQMALLAGGGRHLLVSGDTVTVITDDRPGVFSRIAGVLSLHGLDVAAAAAHSTDAGRALSEFRVHDPMREEPPWPKVLRDLELALDGRLAVQARVAERARAYARRRKAVARHLPANVRFDNSASETATVVDVHAADAVGVLYRITRAMAELDLDIRSAKVQTLGGAVVDAFYVRDRHGHKILAGETLSEIERAILHGLVD